MHDARPAAPNCRSTIAREPRPRPPRDRRRHRRPSRRQAVGFHDDRETRTRRSDRRQRLLGGVADDEARGRNAVPGHERLRVGFRALEGGARRPEGRQLAGPAARNRSAEALFEGRLGAHHRQVDSVPRSPARASAVRISNIGRTQAAQPRRCPGCPGRDDLRSPGSRERRQARACSRPPAPRTRTCTGTGFYDAGASRRYACYSTVVRRRSTARRRQIQRERGCRTVAEVKIQEGESIESALRRFKRKVQQEDIIKDIKKHSFYLKPGDKRRAKQALARKRSRKKQRRDTE